MGLGFQSHIPYGDKQIKQIVRLKLAKRPVFIVSSQKDEFVKTETIDFEWHKGLTIQQKQKSIESFHKAFLLKFSSARVLEVSTKSTSSLGKSLSAFNLKTLVGGKEVSVETAFQSSKVFENGGPYLDLLERSSMEAKQDCRIRASGKIVGFEFNGQQFSSEPKSLFYDWLYMTALMSHPTLVQQLQEFNAFSDIEFNPAKSLNCQAKCVALFLGMKNQFNKGLEFSSPSVLFKKIKPYYSRSAEEQIDLFG